MVKCQRKKQKNGYSIARALKLFASININAKILQRSTRMQQATLLRILYFLWLRPVRFRIAIYHTIRLVHHSQYQRLIR